MQELLRSSLRKELLSIEKEAGVQDIVSETLQRNLGPTFDEVWGGWCCNDTVRGAKKSLLRFFEPLLEHLGPCQPPFTLRA